MGTVRASEDLAATKRLQITLGVIYLCVSVEGLVLMALDLQFCRTPAWYATFTVVELTLLGGVVTLGIRRARLAWQRPESSAP
ncbi:MAG TPA: hypothetical protein VF635_14270 [Propionibacteriaceae bacterium]